MKTIPILIALSLCACAYLQTPQGQALIASSEQIANVAISAAATTYGGPAAGQIAAAGLDALAQVLNGYIDKTVPAQIVQASPGVAGVGPAVAPLIATNKIVTAENVATITQAAAIARKGKRTQSP